LHFENKKKMGKNLSGELLQNFANKVSNVFAHLGYILPRDHSLIFAEFLGRYLRYFLCKAKIIGFWKCK
jgi:hypothetical protein